VDGQQLIKRYSLKPRLQPSELNWAEISVELSSVLLSSVVLYTFFMLAVKKMRKTNRMTPNITYCSFVHQTYHRNHCRRHRSKICWYNDLRWRTGIHRHCMLNSYRQNITTVNIVIAKMGCSSLPQLKVHNDEFENHAGSSFLVDRTKGRVCCRFVRLLSSVTFCIVTKE